LPHPQAADSHEHVELVHVLRQVHQYQLPAAEHKANQLLTLGKNNNYR